MIILVYPIIKFNKHKIVKNIEKIFYIRIIENILLKKKLYIFQKFFKYE